MPIYPDVVALTKVTGSVTVTSVPASSYKKQTVTMSTRYQIVGMPEVSTSTSNAEAEVVSGGKNSFVVKAVNTDIADQDIDIDYTVYVLEGS